MPEALDRILERLSPLLGEPGGAPEPLGGGMTNLNYRVRLGGSEYVVRVTSPEAGHLEIDRAAEFAASQVAASLGLGPAVAAFLPDVGCLVTHFIPGRPVPVEELRAPAMLGQVAAGIRAFHACPPIPSSFSAFRVVETYADTARSHGAALPADYEPALRVSREIESALVDPEHLPVPCHNDLLNANLIYDGSRVRLVDWEYAGVGDRYFDLGNLSINNGFDEADDRELLTAYFGQPCTPRRFAGLRLMRLMSDFREAMWGVVQSVVSPIVFDYTAYATRHFDRLRTSAADPRYRDWLRDARG
jgi:thiamine kinase-like enzyme